MLLTSWLSFLNTAIPQHRRQGGPPPEPPPQQDTDEGERAKFRDREFSQRLERKPKGVLNTLYFLPSGKKPFAILKNVNEIIKPCRMTLLLRLPSSGKTSLLLALAGKLNPTLKMLEYLPQMLQEYLHGLEQIHFMCASGVDQFKQQFVHLEKHCGKVPRSPLRRRYASLPRERICASIDEESEQDMESKYHPIR